jgi:hypothetical protein
MQLTLEVVATREQLLVTFQELVVTSLQTLQPDLSIQSTEVLTQLLDANLDVTEPLRRHRKLAQVHGVVTLTNPDHLPVNHPLGGRHGCPVRALGDLHQAGSTQLICVDGVGSALLTQVLHFFFLPL